ncbi:hypothetical protein C0993_012234 [Termitomyces sp. T159_Od127]|nr:hypothetical protein C0993_012234 [Termitomyces sp. T159_Od127]
MANITRSGLEAPRQSIQELPACRTLVTSRLIEDRATADLSLADNVVAAAKANGIRLIVALTNNWSDYGGMDVYVRQLLNSQNHDLFYTDATVQAAFKDYVETFVTRYKDEPTILAWELANEPRCRGSTGTSTGTCTTSTVTAWIKTFSAYIKSIDSNHLVAVGDEGFYNEPNGPNYPYQGSEGVDFAVNLAIDTVDFGTFHAYPAWNRGKLRSMTSLRISEPLLNFVQESLYAGIDPSTVSAKERTAYKWSFASKSSQAEVDALRATREEIGAATYNRGPLELSSQAGSSSRGRMQGPALPSASDLALSRELAAEREQEERLYKRKRDQLEAKERIEDMVGPREVGREGMLEKKRVRREADKNFREKGDEGLEADESTLLGGGDSFKDMVARRDAAKNRYNSAREEKVAAARERAEMFKQKEQATMDMFQQLAKQRFG